MDLKLTKPVNHRIRTNNNVNNQKVRHITVTLKTSCAPGFPSALDHRDPREIVAALATKKHAFTIHVFPALSFSNVRMRRHTRGVTISG